MFQNKKFFHKIYDKNGVYLKTWSTEIINVPSFKMVINSGLGEMTIKLARPFGNFGEDNDVAFRNRVETYISDKEAQNGRLIYSGYISDYQPVLEGGQEYVDITVFGWVVELEDSDFFDRTTGRTAMNYNDKRVDEIIDDILTKAIANGLNIAKGDLDNTGEIISRYTFNNVSYRSAIDKAREMSPENWFWVADVDQSDRKTKVYFREANVSSADHTFIIGKHLLKFEPFKSIRDLKNIVRFIGGFFPDDPTEGEIKRGKQFYKVYDETTFEEPFKTELLNSINNYGRRVKIIYDSNVLREETADKIAWKFLRENYLPFVRATVEIIDSNGDDIEGYDIESIKAGDTCTFIDPKFMGGSQTYALNKIFIIQSVEYNYDFVRLELSVRPPWFPLAMKKSLLEFERERVAEIPISPMNVDVEGVAEDDIQNLSLGSEKQKGRLIIFSGKIALDDKEDGGITYSRRQLRKIVKEEGEIREWQKIEQKRISPPPVGEWTTDPPLGLNWTMRTLASTGDEGGFMSSHQLRVFPVEAIDLDPKNLENLGKIEAKIEDGKLQMANLLNKNGIDMGLLTHEDGRIERVNSRIDIECSMVFTVMGELAVGTKVAPTLLPATNGRIFEIVAFVQVAPVGNSIKIDILKDDGVLHTAEINDGSKIYISPELNMTDLKNKRFDIDITQVGSTTKGSNLTVLVRTKQMPD